MNKFDLSVYLIYLSVIFSPPLSPPPFAHLITTLIPRIFSPPTPFPNQYFKSRDAESQLLVFATTFDIITRFHVQSLVSCDVLKLLQVIIIDHNIFRK